MLIIVTILILLSAAAGIVIWRALRPSMGFAWLVALVSALLAWVSVWLWQTRMPVEITLSLWQPADLFTYSPALQADGPAWAFALALTSACLAAILTAPLRALPVNPLTQAGILTLTALGLVAVTARNPLTLLLAWGALDLAELIIVLRTFEKEQQSESAVFGFSMRSVGTGLLMWASANSMALGIRLEFNSVPQQVGLYLILAAAFRLGIFPIHLPYAGAPVLRRGLGSILRVVSAASSLILLAHIPQSAVAPALALWLLPLIGMTALFAAWRWFRADDELAGRPYWIIGMGALALIAALGGNQTGSAALGIALVLLGSLVFYHSHSARLVKLIALVALVAGLGLPFTLTAAAWHFSQPLHWWMWPFVIGAQVLLMAGLARFILLENRMSLAGEQQAGQGIIFPIALGMLAAVVIALGAWGWEGALEIGAWWAGGIIAVLTVASSWLRLRLKFLAAGQAEPQPPRLRPLITTAQAAAAAWSVYYGARRAVVLVTQTFEGDGGILWTLLLLVLFITLVQGAL